MRLNAADLKEAEHLWIRSVQASAFSKEIAFLLSKDHSSAPPAYVTQFGLFLVDDIIKCKGKLNNALLPVNTKKPILLPAKHEFTCLVIKQSHESDRCTLKLRIPKTKSRNHRRSMFACSRAHLLELYIWNLHKPLVLNRSYLPSEDSLVEEDCRLPLLLTTPRRSALHLKTYVK